MSPACHTDVPDACYVIAICLYQRERTDTEPRLSVLSFIYVYMFATLQLYYILLHNPGSSKFDLRPHCETGLPSTSLITLDPTYNKHSCHHDAFSDPATTIML